jgi:hypothetical protein
MVGRHTRQSQFLLPRKLLEGIFFRQRLRPRFEGQCANEAYGLAHSGEAGATSRLMKFEPSFRILCDTGVEHITLTEQEIHPHGHERAILRREVQRADIDKVMRYLENVSAGLYG